MSKFLGEFDEIWVDDNDNDVIIVGNMLKCKDGKFHYCSCNDIFFSWKLYSESGFSGGYKVSKIVSINNEYITFKFSKFENLLFRSDDWIKV